MDFVHLFPKEILTSVGMFVVFCVGLVVAGKIKWIPINLIIGKTNNGTPTMTSDNLITRDDLRTHCKARQNDLDDKMTRRDGVLDQKFDLLYNAQQKIFDKVDDLNKVNMEILQRLSRMEGAAETANAARRRST